MSLNIKNERVHDLVREAARLTGKSQTATVEEALIRLLEAYDADPDAARVARTIDVVRGVVAEYAADPATPPANPAVRSVGDLYDDVSGLPR